jgi:hypothetical protein
VQIPKDKIPTRRFPVVAVLLVTFVNRQHLIALLLLVNVLEVLERLVLELLLVRHVHQQMVAYRTQGLACAHLVLDAMQSVGLFAMEVLPRHAVMHLLVKTLAV